MNLCVDNSAPPLRFVPQIYDSKREKCCRRHSRYNRINKLDELRNVRSSYDKIFYFILFCDVDDDFVQDTVSNAVRLLLVLFH